MTKNLIVIWRLERIIMVGNKKQKKSIVFKTIDSMLTFDGSFIWNLFFAWTGMAFAVWLEFDWKSVLAIPLIWSIVPVSWYLSKKIMNRLVKWATKIQGDLDGK